MRIANSIVSLLLAFLVLLASSSFYVTSHACGGRINKIAFLEKADGCGHSLMPPCHRKMMKGCCEDETITHDAQDLKMESKLSVNAVPAFIFIADAVLLSEIIPVHAYSETGYVNYDTPLRSDDLLVAHHVFLI